MRRWTANILARANRSNIASTTHVHRACTCTVTRQHTSQAAAARATNPPLDASSSVPPLENVASGSISTIRRTASTSTKPTVDPYKILEPELANLRKTLLHLLGSSHPALTSIAEYYFLHPSKQLRPLLVLLFARATNGLGGSWPEKRSDAEEERGKGRAEELDAPLSRADVLNDWNPNMPDYTHSFEQVFEITPPRRPHPPAPSFASSSSTLLDLNPTLAVPSVILPTQIRLAQIVEMIHVASLLHDDVIDASPLRRGVSSAPAAFGNKLAVLAGDFLLGRASAALSRLGSSEALELIAGVIANLVEGEILQMQRVQAGSAEPGELSGIAAEATGGTELGAWTGAAARPGPGAEGGRVSREILNVYLRKTYLKTASLMAKGARAAVVLGGAREGEVWKEVAYAYGRNLGIAFQLVDDILDYEAGEGTLGKPGGADLRLGLATGPALFAWEEHAAMGPLIARKFEQEGDVELARDLVRRSSGVERTRDLALAHANKAREVLHLLPASEARSALEVLTERVVKRTW